MGLVFRYPLAKTLDDSVNEDGGSRALQWMFFIWIMKRSFRLIKAKLRRRKWTTNNSHKWVNVRNSRLTEQYRLLIYFEEREREVEVPQTF